MYNGENKVYFYGFDKLHQLQGNPWHLTGNWITIQNIKDTARKMMRRLNTTEVIVLDGSLETAREYKELTLSKNYKNPTEHILFYDFLLSQEHFKFGLV